jgi:hypothetical protein
LIIHHLKPTHRNQLNQVKVFIPIIASFSYHPTSYLSIPPFFPLYYHPTLLDFLVFSIPALSLPRSNQPIFIGSHWGH